MPPRPKSGSQPHRVYPPGKRHFELIASVSRSSGLEKDGDALRDYKTQEEYRDFIQGKVNDYWKRFPYGRPVRDVKARDEVQGNILIQFRKLREGLMSTKRNDEFALEVYETSLYLAALFSSPVQVTSIVSQLLPHMYRSHQEHHSRSLPIVILSCLHFLGTAYPSQSRFLEHLASIPSYLLPKSSDARRWLWALARSMRQRNYTRLEQLTARATFSALVAAAHPQEAPSPKVSGAPDDLASEVIATLVGALRTKARETVWSVLRSAYRELSCPTPDAAQEQDDTSTRVWLCRSLLLAPVTLPTAGQVDPTLIDDWLKTKHASGHIRPRDGVEGRWVVLKVTK